MKNVLLEKKVINLFLILNSVNKTINDINSIVFYEDYLNKFSRILMIHHLYSPHGLRSFLFSMPRWLSKNLWLDK